MSTAIMYAFDNRPDTIGVDEPYYARYLHHHPHIDHPGREDIIQSQAIDEDSIVERIHHLAKEYDYVFVKNMAHHAIDIDLDKLKAYKTFFLIRDPAKLINSFSKVISKPSIHDIGLADEYELYQGLVQCGEQAIVLDSGDLLAHPAREFEKLCDQLNIPFDKSMLQWTAGARPIDGVWAPYWYKSVHQSTQITPQKQKDIILAEAHQELLKKAMPYYEALKAQCL